jgi:hypothetical protein
VAFPGDQCAAIEAPAEPSSEPPRLPRLVAMKSEKGRIGPFVDLLVVLDFSDRVT